MRVVALLFVLLTLAVTGCSDVKKEIDKPGPAPPYDPKAAELDPSLVKPSVTPDADQDQPADDDSK